MAGCLGRQALSTRSFSYVIKANLVSDAKYLGHYTAHRMYLHYIYIYAAWRRMNVRPLRKPWYTNSKIILVILSAIGIYSKENEQLYVQGEKLLEKKYYRA
jgi:hypothetical protein